jgi:NTP pyrophosphatase (non-canonical NTP hydrolase)
MDFKDIIKRALEIRAKYSELELNNYGNEWTREQTMEAFVGDVGDLMKLVMAKSGVRNIDNVDEKLAHELCDCLWCVIILAKKYNVNLEESFLGSMNDMEGSISRLS